MMYKLLKNLSVLFCAVVFFGSCRKEKEEFYERPENLAPPIYQVLASKGNFTTLLAVIDKSGYKNTLSNAGYWTLFAPNDAAFQKYFSEKNTSLAAMDSVTARKIVTYCLVYNAFQTNHIADFQSTAQPVGWVANAAYKRRTAYYDGFYTGTGPDGANSTLLSSNRNGSYLLNDNNNKHIPYFYSTYMTARNLTESDYKYFFPNSTYNGFNVVDAQVLSRDILAENGVIHEIDRVVLPLPNLEDQLASNPQYSLYKRILERFMVTYATSNDINNRYRILTGKSNNVYVKFYNPTLAFSPNNENFLKTQENDAQSDGYTMFIPTNDVLYKYLNDVVLEFFKTTPNQQLSNAEIDALVNTLPPNIVTDLLNAHLFQTTVWPSKFTATANFLNEPARFNVNTDIIDRKFCSNGIFYGTNQPQRTNVFSTVFARAYLDPRNYSIMTTLLNNGLRTIVSNPNLRYTVFMMPDAALRAAGYNYDAATTTYSFTSNGATVTGNGVRDQLLRILQLSIVPTPNNELDNLSGNGIIETVNGEYIRWDNNIISSGGTVEKGLTFRAVDSKTYVNGKVYYLDNNGLLFYPEKTIPQEILFNNADNSSSPYYAFYQYLKNSQIYNAVTQDITGLTVGASYTVLIPTNAAIAQAVRDGILPGTAATGVPNFTPSLSTDKDKVSRFILYHIINGLTIAPDGKKSPNGTAQPTVLRDGNGNVVNVSVFNQPNNLRIQDNFGRSATVLPASSSNTPGQITSNYLGNRTLFHLINNYLQYTY
ncbi:fasciclin domain-containing protein [Mucilaginibacter sp. PAMB04274]|uniref:fasciclin domain-containing protein n=1 Tax=Mucilaginibacter sp. PAMB04274 TaxID=3138568 RepID=UPI0031F600AD